MRMPRQAGFRFPAARQIWLVASLLVILAVVTAVRIRLLNMPLERDEGEYAYAGQRMLQGVPPYQDVYSMKWPGTFAAYALFMGIFGQTAGGIHTGLILVNLATAVLVLVLAKRVCGDIAGVVAAATYALLSISTSTLGLAAHANHFVVLFALGGILLIQKFDERTSPARFVAAGLLLGLAALMKQSGAVFGLFAALWIVRQEAVPAGKDSRRLATRLACLALGGLLPLLLTGAMLARAGVFGRFWFWTIEYAHVYSAIFTPVKGMQALFSKIANLFQAAPGLWSAAALGLVLLFYERSLRSTRFFVLGFAVFSFFAVCLGWYFRQHYFLLLLPATGVLAGMAVEAASRLLARLQLPFSPATFPLLLFAAAVVWPLVGERAIFFRLAPNEASRAIYGANPFSESVEIGRYLKSHCPPGAPIAVIGSEPELYFYSHRRSATGYIYTYPLMEPQPYAAEMQKEMIREIEKADPDYVVFVHVGTSWLQFSDSNPLIFDWFGKYQREQLRLVGLVEIQPGGQTQYQWFDQSETNVQTSAESWLAIFQRRADDAKPERN